MYWDSIIAAPIQEMLGKIASFIPVLLGALVILVIGWLIAKLIESIVAKVLKAVKFDKLADKAQISDILSKGEIKLTASQMIAALSYWLVMIMVLVMVVNALGLTVASQLLEGLLAYIPRVIAAIFVLVLGMFLGNFVSGVVRTASSNASLPKPDMLGGISKWAIIIFAGTISLGQLGVAPLLVASTFNIFFGGVCLALALAFGLGGKDAAARYIEEIKKRHLR